MCSKDNELNIVVARLKQVFAKDNKAKIPHMIYEHYEVGQQGPSTTCQDTAGGKSGHRRVSHKWSRIPKCDQEEKRRYDSTARRRVYGHMN